MATSRTGFGRSVLMINQKDIVLIRFPFSDLSGSKVRPAVVVSNDGYNGRSLDVIVLAMTSNLALSLLKVFVENTDLDSGTLPVKSAVRVDKPFSALQTSILKVQAKLSAAKFAEVQRAFQNIF